MSDQQAQTDHLPAKPPDDPSGRCRWVLVKCPNLGSGRAREARRRHARDRKCMCNGTGWVWNSVSKAAVDA